MAGIGEWLAGLFNFPNILGAGGILREEDAIRRANEHNEQLFEASGRALGLPRGHAGSPFSVGFDPSRIGESGPYKAIFDSLAADKAMGADQLGALTIAANRGLYDLGQNVAGQYGELGAGYDALRRGVGNQGAQLSSRLESGYGDLGRGFAQRESDVMGLLRGLGATERADIGERFNNLGAANLADLRARGLGSSTLTGNALVGNERARSRELGAAEERIRTQMAGALSGLRADTLGATERGLLGVTGLGERNLDRTTGLGVEGLAARERGIGLGAGLEADRLGAFQQNELNRINFLLGTGAEERGLRGQQLGGLLNLLGSYQAQVPNTDAWGDFGRNWTAQKQAEAYKSAQPSGLESFFTGAAPGFGQAAGLWPFLWGDG